MDIQKTISSLQNPLIKKVLQLQEKSRVRKKSNLFVVEGQRELTLAQKGGYEIKTILFCEDISSNTTFKALEYIAISKTVYEKIAYRETTEGVIAIVQSKMHTLDTINFTTKNPLVLVAEAPEKPGNIGALLRTADAANIDAVLIANLKTDLYNPNSIRSSIGCIFTTKIAIGTTEEIITFLEQKHIAINCAALNASINYTKVDFTLPTAIVVGTEATGLSNTWLEKSNQNIIIPMQGEIDSMNVSVAAAILIFEAKRQRGF